MATSPTASSSSVLSDERLDRWLAALLATPGLTAIRDDAKARATLLDGALAAAELLGDGPIVDVGSGGGSPGIPLASVRPNLDFALLVPEPAPDGGDGFDYDRARPIAATAIRQLPPDRQALLSLAYIDGESRQSLSERFGVPVGTIKTWLRRTLETVRTDCAAFAEAQAAQAG